MDDLETIDGDIAYAQISGILVEIISHDDCPVRLRRDKDESGLIAGRLLQPILVNARKGSTSIPVELKADSIVLFTCQESYPDRFWVKGIEYHVIDADAIALYITTGDFDDVSVESYGELLE